MLRQRAFVEQAGLLAAELATAGRVIPEPSALLLLVFGIAALTTRPWHRAEPYKH
jgi:hypothetical protein